MKSYSTVLLTFGLGSHSIRYFNKRRRRCISEQICRIGDGRIDEASVNSRISCSVMEEMLLE